MVTNTDCWIMEVIDPMLMPFLEGFNAAIAIMITGCWVPTLGDCHEMAQSHYGALYWDQAEFQLDNDSFPEASAQ